MTVEEEEVPPLIEDLLPSTDQTVQPGDEVEISFRSVIKNGVANFKVQFPAQATPQSSANNPMVEVEPGFYKGTWIAPNIDLQGAVIEVELTDSDGNTVVTRSLW